MKEEKGKAFIDTGTTFVYFGNTLYQSWVSSFKSFCKKSKNNCGKKGIYDDCYWYDSEKFSDMQEFYSTFPKTTFYFNGNIEYDWNPEEYLAVALDSNEHYCIGVKSLKDVILGAIFMRNRDFYFNKEKKQIGFIRSSCTEPDSAPLKFIAEKKNEDSKLISNTSKLIDSVINETKITKEIVELKKLQKENSNLFNIASLSIIGGVLVLLFLGYSFIKNKMIDKN